MTTGIGDSATAGKLVYVLPRFEFQVMLSVKHGFPSPRQPFCPTNRIHRDEVIQLPRPAWLDIYRQFPYQHVDEPPDPARGTLVISDDDEWLTSHVNRLIAVAFVLGLPGAQWQVPADAFSILVIRGNGGTPRSGDAVHKKRWQN